jgi:putative membrane protein
VIPYLWVKTFHVLAVVAWLAGIFYLPRIFVHHALGMAAGEDVRRLLVMARNLFAFTSLMALIALLLGSLLWLGYDVNGTWLHVKLAFVVGLVIYHIACIPMLKRILSGRPAGSSGTLRIFNESSLLLVIPTLILAIVKPWN